MSRRLLKYGAEAFKPHFVDGRWQRPLISKRVVRLLSVPALFSTLPPSLGRDLPALCSFLEHPSPSLPSLPSLLPPSLPPSLPRIILPLPDSMLSLFSVHQHSLIPPSLPLYPPSIYSPLPNHHSLSQAARLRKEALANGTYGSFQDSTSTASSSSSQEGRREGGKIGGWDPAWDRVEAPRVLRPAKLHARERSREERYGREREKGGKGGVEY